METLTVRNWQALYEVSDKDHPWSEGKGFRKGALPFVRLRVQGSTWSEGWRDFLARAGEKRAAAAFGVFCKCLEIAAAQSHELRGRILDRHGNPMDAGAIARVVGFSANDVQSALDILTDHQVGWLEWADSPGASRSFPEFPGNSGNSPRIGIEQNRTEEEENAPTGAAPPPLNSKSDPLESLPRLRKIYPEIRAAILAAHPKARLPEEGTAAEIEDRRELERLIRLDGYSETAVLDTLGWVLKADDRDARFWRSNFRAFGPLRKVKEGASKFTKMHEAMVKATAGGNGHGDDGRAAETAMLELLGDRANG